MQAMEVVDNASDENNENTSPIHSIVELTKEAEKIIALRTRSRFKY